MKELSNNRLVIIKDHLYKKGFVKISDLSEILNVSESTIRRDLDFLAKLGKIQRVHGGAQLEEKQTSEAPVVLRQLDNSIEKQKIGEIAASLVSEGDTVFIGSGSTSLEVARSIVGRKNLTVVTNALTVANLLANEDQITLVVLGGVMRHSELSFIGHITEQALKEIRIDKAFMGIPGISLRAGLTNDYLPEVITDRMIFSSANELILLADHTKFGKVFSAFVFDLSHVKTLITDEKTNQELLDEISSLGINVIIATKK